MALEGAELGERRSVCLVFVTVDVRETTNDLAQRRCGNNIVVESLVFELLHEI